MNKFVAFLIGIMVVFCTSVAQAQNRVEHNGQDLFLNGLNLAWDDFANDIGPSLSTPDISHFDDVFSQMEANGANSMRLWLHTNGANTPAWSGSAVTGPGTDTIADLQTILDLAWERDIGMMLCLWSFDMLRIAYGPGINDRARAILTNDTARASYVDNSLIPMVTALAGHPAIIAWEIFNEPEGMSDEFGWAGIQHVPMADIQSFINVCAGTIHRADPFAKVTNGSWSFWATTDVGAGNYNYYTDARLIAAGGDPDGTLDFYCVHYYGASSVRSPFQNAAAHWALDKPLVVAEFFANCSNCTATPYETLYQGGYAGALAWSWTDGNHALMLGEINDLSTTHPGDTLIALSGAPTVSITSPTNDQLFTGSTTVSITADAADSNGTVSKVEFYQGGTKLGEDTTDPYEYDWVNPPGGAYVLKAFATDNDSIRSAAPFVSIQYGIPPSVTLTLPVNGASYANGATVSMAATASDTDGTVTKVEFFRDAVNLGEDASDPYQYDWVGPPGGNYQITAVATDDSGLTDTSAVANITVGNPMPPTRLEAEDAVYTGSTAAILDATASGGQFLDMTGDTTNETIRWDVYNVPYSGTFQVGFGMQMPYAPIRYQYLTINGVPQLNLVFFGEGGYWQEPFEWLSLNEGYNEIQITALNGWMWFDYIQFYFPPPTNDPPVVTSMSVSSGQVQLTVTGDAGPDYTLRTTTNMQTWNPVYTTNPPVLPFLMTDTNLNADPFRAYQIDMGP